MGTKAEWVSKGKVILIVAKGYSDFKIETRFFSISVRSFNIKFHVKA